MDQNQLDASDYYSFPKGTYLNFKEYVNEVKQNKENEEHGAMVERKNTERSGNLIAAAADDDLSYTSTVQSPPARFSYNIPAHSDDSREYVKGNLFNRSMHYQSPPPSTYLHSPPSHPQHSMRSPPPSLFTVDSMLSPSYHLPPDSTDFTLSSPMQQPAFSPSSTITKPAAITADTTVAIAAASVTSKRKTPKKGKRNLKTNLSPSVSPSNNVSKRLNLGKKKRQRWSDDETTIVVEIYKKWAQKLRTNKKTSTWELIRRQYDLRCKQEGVSSTKTTKQIQDRIDYLVDKYKKVKDNSNLTGRGKMSFKWYDQMSAILDHRSAVVPTNVSEVLSEKQKCSKKSIKRSANPNSSWTSAVSDSSPDTNNTPTLDLLYDDPTSDLSSQVETPITHINPNPLAHHDSDPSDQGSDHSDSEDSDASQGNDGDGATEEAKPAKRMSKQSAFAELVTSLKSEMAKQTKEVQRQNKHFRKAADADRVILEKLADGYKADSEANAKLAAALADLIKKD